MQVRGIDFVGIAVGDLDAARHFYGEVLGLPALGTFGDSWAEFDAGNVTLSLFKADPAAIAKRLEAGPYASIGVAIAVPDVGAAIDELRQRGIKVLMETTEGPPCFTAMVEDPSGNFVWLHHRKDGTAG